MAPAPSRSQIRVNALGRLTKEHQLYVKELSQYRSQLAELQGTSGSDPYELKKLRQLTAETESILPRVHERIESELKALKSMDVEDDMKDTVAEATKKAQEYLSACKN